MKMCLNNISILKYFLLLSMMLTFYSCGNQKNLDVSRKEIIRDWNTLLTELERFTPGYRGPVSARMFAYVELGAYLSSIGECDFLNTSDFLNNLELYHGVEEKGIEPGIAINSCFADLAEMFFPTVSEDFKARVSQLNQKCKNKFINRLSPEAFNRSLLYGKEVAHKIWEYSKTDKVGHDGFLFNYDNFYIPPACKGCWQQIGERPMPALLPHWGKIRTFLIKPGDIAINPPIPFDTTVFSDYFKQAQELVYVSENNSKEDKWIAEFWSDDKAGLTMTPVGRWFSIASQASAKSNLSFRKVLELNMVLGLAMNDASAITWAAKYHYNVQRPEAFIQKYIQPTWVSMIPAPSFPAYPSGHSVFGATAAVILENYFGSNFNLTDNSHEGRKEFLGKPRTFNSFFEMANENARSRMHLGVHFRMDCEEGMRLGTRIGKVYTGKKGFLSING
ncbi:MAG: vanadium-dependent haloperoxidase [Saprospiraceae bacterium]|nr:vanadium-dependent haloperoxidase [Saprospiraceae bacterium]HRG33448.1 vanadium-dependent haloperoxidase [Saprospiraceae bacterium]